MCFEFMARSASLAVAQVLRNFLVSSDGLIKSLDVNNSGVVWMVYVDARKSSRMPT